MGSRSDDTVYDARHRHRSETRDVFGMLRRFAVTLTSGGFWQGVGLLLIDQATKETQKAEIFPGIGIYGRPPPNANAEGVIGYLGADAQNPVWLGVRDEDTRRAVTGSDGANVQPNETILYNGKCYLVLRADGSIVVRFPATGGELRLVTLTEFNALATWVRSQFAVATGHVHATPSGPTTTITVASAPPDATPNNARGTGP